LIPRPGEAFVEDVEVEELAQPQVPPLEVDVVMKAGFLSNYSRPLSEVSRIRPSSRVKRLVIGADMKIVAVVISNGARAELKVPAPFEATSADVSTRVVDVMSAGLVDHGSTPFVESEGPGESTTVGSLPIDSDVKAAGCVVCRREARFVEGQHLEETS
jgi:hypothetical protein